MDILRLLKSDRSSLGSKSVTCAKISGVDNPYKAVNSMIKRCLKDIGFIRILKMKIELRVGLFEVQHKRLGCYNNLDEHQESLARVKDA